MTAIIALIAFVGIISVVLLGSIYMNANVQ